MKGKFILLISILQVTDIKYIDTNNISKYFKIKINLFFIKKPQLRDFLNKFKQTFFIGIVVAKSPCLRPKFVPFSCPVQNQ